MTGARTIGLGRTGLLLGACLAAAACTGPGNTGRTRISDELAMNVPWVTGRPPLRDAANQVIVPREPVYPPIATGMADPGSAPPDCSAMAGLEFSSVWYLTFEAVIDPLIPNAVGVADRWAGHDDDSEGSFRVPGELNWYLGLRQPEERYDPDVAPWGMPADRVEGAPTCDGAPNEWALHFRGGRFNRFGGGIGHPLAERRPCPDDSGQGLPDDRLCHPEYSVAAGHQGDHLAAVGIPAEPPGSAPGTLYTQAHRFWNISGFDGIAFWARRGPEGQGPLTVIIQDKHTSEDLARQNETFCRRLVQCRTECLNGAPCSPVVDPTDAEDTKYRCFDPAEGPLPAGQDEALLFEVYPPCGPTACTFPSNYPDVDYEGKACRPYTFDSHTTGEYCFDEGDPPPPDSDERCGDGYARTVTLTTDWKFYKVPFSELRQQGFGRVSPYMDLTTVSNISFVAMTGWVDFYLDNVTFYREVN